MDLLPVEIIVFIATNFIGIRDIQALRCTDRYINFCLREYSLRKSLIYKRLPSYLFPHPNNLILSATKLHDVEFIEYYYSLGGYNPSSIFAAAISNNLQLFKYVAKSYPSNNMTQIIQPAIRHECLSVINYILDNYTVDLDVCLPATAFCKTITLTKLFESKGANAWKPTLVLAVILGNKMLTSYATERIHLDNSNNINIKVW